MKHLLPFSAEFCREIAFYQSDIKKNWDSNKEICKRFGFFEFEKLHRVLLPCIELCESEENWVSHPLGVKLVLKLIQHYWKYSDQVTSVLLCLFLMDAFNYRNLDKSNTDLLCEELRNTKFSNGLFSASALDVVFTHLKELSELLLCWEIHTGSAKVQKLIQPLNLNRFLLTGSKSLNYKKQHIFTKHLKNKCTSCEKEYLICCLCLGPVNGMAVFCEQCGHGGHLKHLKSWFRHDYRCPAACGHNCLAYK